MTPLETNTAGSLRIKNKKVASTVDHFTLTTEQVTKHKERANKRKVEQEPEKISKRNAKKRLEYEPIAGKQNNKSLHEKERQSLAKDKEIICNSIFDGMDSTVEEYNVNLRILKLWCGQLHGAGSMQSMVFSAKDEKGSCRQGFVPIGLAEHWKSIINEGSSYAISRVSIIDCNNYVKLIDHKHQTFTERTTSMPLSDTDIPLEPLYNFQKLDIIQQIEKDDDIHQPTEAIKTEILKDVLTLVIDVRPPTTRHTKKKLIHFAEVFMTDETIFPKVCVLTIWKEEYERTKIFTLPFKKQFVLLASDLKGNNFRGRYGLQTCMFTRFKIEPENMPESRLLLKEVTDKTNQIQATYGEISRFSELYCKTPEVIYTISQLRALTSSPPIPGKDLYYTIRATISRIYTELSMTYRACAMCPKRMKYEVSDQYGCPNPSCANRQGNTTSRYKITIDIKDDTDRLNLVIFNHDAEKIIHISAPELENLKLEDNGLCKIHNLITKAHGKEFKFAFRHDYTNHKYSLKGQYTVSSLDWSPRAFNPMRNTGQALEESTTSYKSSDKEADSTDNDEIKHNVVSDSEFAEGTQ
ncbi:uncharacterized protein LOC109836606 isoform X2 [Asparagus officinalis]|uniref:uncharacterized protein LOC109836606 isoform X2 n=1 Tax=Asparagus officinalis TaxID=4686 RepID=UPI00098E1358|nr:uncharacterized protein LOC109836606 isoform X2 [Asparagus officinalis]